MPFWKLLSPNRTLERKDAPAPIEGAFGLDWLVSPNTKSGPIVTPQTALSVPAVAASVDLIGSTMGSLPAKVYKRDNQAKQVDTDHPAHALVHRNANDFQSAGRLRAQLTMDALLYGNGFAYANRVGGKVQELLRLDPRTIDVTISEAGAPIYRSNTETGRVYDHADLIHIAASVSYDGISGIAPIHLHREAIGLALTLEAHAARLFSRGARPSGLLKFPNKLTADAITRIKSSFNSVHAGDESGRTAVLEDGGEFVPLTFTSVDSEFSAQRQAQAYEIARAFGVPPSMIGLVDRATWGNAETQNRQFLTFTLRPWLQIFRDEFERVLFSKDERATHLIDFVVDDLVRPDSQTKANNYQTLRSSGIVTANEVRAWENLPPLADGNTLTSPFTTAGKETTE